MTASVKFWVLVGHWHGTPCAILRGGYKPCWTAWFVSDEEQWLELRNGGYYTRKSSRRPTDYVDKEFQRTLPEDVFEDGEE